jgi:hypothetical protein
MMKIPVFKGFDNVEVFTIFQDGVAFDLLDTGFTSGKVWCSGVSVDVVIEGNAVRATLGDLLVPAGTYEAKIVVYSAFYPDGLVIVGTGLPETLQLTIRE